MNVITKKFSLIDNGVRKTLYKTSHFRKIKKIKVVSTTKDTFTSLGCEYKPKNKWTSDWLIERNRYSSQVNLHVSLDEAKHFVRNNLSSRISKLQADVIKFKGIMSDFE